MYQDLEEIIEAYSWLIQLLCPLWEKDAHSIAFIGIYYRRHRSTLSLGLHQVFLYIQLHFIRNRFAALIVPVWLHQSGA